MRGSPADADAAERDGIFAGPGCAGHHGGEEGRWSWWIVLSGEGRGQEEKYSLGYVVLVPGEGHQC